MALSVVWPQLTNSTYRMPTLFILCGSLDSFNVFRPTATAIVRDKRIYDGTSFLAEDGERSAIVINYDTVSKRIDPYRAFYKQYARFLLRRSGDGKIPPAWFEEGLSELVRTIDFQKKYIEFGKIDESVMRFFNRSPAVAGSASADAGRSMAAKSTTGRYPSNPLTGGRGMSSYDFSAGQHILPLENMFSEDFRKRDFLQWSAQCYAFTHMCLYGMREKYQKGFMDFVQKAYEGSTNEDDFKECFGRTYKEMAVILRGYLDFADHKSILYTAAKGAKGLPDPVPAIARDATQAEIGRIKGEVLRLVGRMLESREAFIVPYLRQERDPALLASLGLLESLEKRNDRAIRFLEDAAKAGVQRPRAYYTLANIRFQKEANNESEDTQLDDAQLASVLEPLMTALKQPPPMPEVYLLFGKVLLRSMTPPDKNQLGILVEGVQNFPKDAQVIYKAAQVFSRYKHAEQVEDLSKIALRLNLTPEMRNNFEQLTVPLSE